MLWEISPEGRHQNPTSFANFRSWREQSTSFVGMAAFSVAPIADFGNGPQGEAFTAMASAIALAALLIVVWWVFFSRAPGLERLGFHAPPGSHHWLAITIALAISTSLHVVVGEVALATVLVFMLLERFTAALPAFAGALVFAVHPVHTEAYDVPAASWEAVQRTREG